jgi:hypothetical protein
MYIVIIDIFKHVKGLLPAIFKQQYKKGTKWQIINSCTCKRALYVPLSVQILLSMYPFISYTVCATRILVF